MTVLWVPSEQHFFSYFGLFHFATIKLATLLAFIFQPKKSLPPTHPPTSLPTTHPSTQPSLPPTFLGLYSPPPQAPFPNPPFLTYTYPPQLASQPAIQPATANLASSSVLQHSPALVEITFFELASHILRCIKMKILYAFGG